MWHIWKALLFTLHDPAVSGLPTSHQGAKGLLYSLIIAEVEHPQMVQSRSDVLGADARQLAELFDADLLVVLVIKALQDYTFPISHVREAPQIGQRLLWGSCLAFTF